MPTPTRNSLWRARTDLPKDPYKDSELECIVRAIEDGANCQLSAGQRKHLHKEVTMVARAFALAQHQFDGPTLGKIEAVLEKLHKAADKLLGIVDTLDDATLFALRRQHGEFDKAYLKAQAQNDSSEKTQTSAIKIVSDLSAETKAAIKAIKAVKAIKEVSKRLPPPGENPLDWIIDWEMDPIYRHEKLITKFVVWMGFIFNEFTGKEPHCDHDRATDTYSGNFLSFIEAGLTPLEEKRREALGRTVQNALPKWREARDAKA